MAELAGIGRAGRERLSKVLEKKPRVITSLDVAGVLTVSRKEANKMLSRWCENGWLSRVKRGVYIPVPLDSTTSSVVAEEPFLIADQIYKPGYVGGFSAIKHWDLTEQIIETIYYFSTKQVKVRSPTHGSIKFRIKTIKKSKNFGTRSIWYGNTKIKISDPTKTVVDILDDPKLVGGMTVVYDVFREYVDSEYCDFGLLLEYSKRMNNRTIAKRLGFMLDVKFEGLPQSLQKLRDDISSGYSNFDPLVKGAFIIEKWKLNVPKSWKQEYDRKK